ncbi:MAG: glycosyltransferase family 39 protein [Bacteroidales bacterium]|nr:glycosyltransferase family 39 protein [Bacteroidales bacterium]
MRKVSLLNFINENERRTLFILVLLTVILRTVFAYIAYSKTGTTRWADDFYYINAGTKIAEGNWFTYTDMRNYLIVGPVIPLLVSLFIRLFNNFIIPFFAYNIISTSLMVPVLYLLGKEVFNKKTGWILAIWGIFFIEAFKYSANINKESTLYLFLPLTLLFLIRSINQSEKIKNIIYASLSFAWLIHTDERFFIYLPLFCLGFFLIKPFRLISFSKLAFVWLFSVLILMLPWSIKNYKIYNQVVILTPRTTVFTSKLWGEYISSGVSQLFDEQAKKEFNVKKFEHGADLIEHYGLVPREYGKKEAILKAFIHFWQPTFFKPAFIQYGFRIQKWSLSHNFASLLFYGIFIPFYVGGIFLMIKRKHFIGIFLAAIPFIHSLMHAFMVWPLERYRSPVTFIIVMIGIFTFVELTMNKRRSHIIHTFEENGI